MLTAHELADELKVSLASIRLWTREGLPCSRLGRLVRFDQDLARNWLQARGEKSAAALSCSLKARWAQRKAKMEDAAHAG